MAGPDIDWDFATTEELRSTAVWAAKKMRKMDWVARHDMLDHFLETRPVRFANILCTMFSPDELLMGTLTGSQPAVGYIIVLNGRAKRPTRLDEFFPMCVD